MLTLRRWTGAALALALAGQPSSLYAQTAAMRPVVGAAVPVVQLPAAVPGLPAAGDWNPAGEPLTAPAELPALGLLPASLERQALSALALSAPASLSRDALPGPLRSAPDGRLGGALGSAPAAWNGPSLPADPGSLERHLRPFLGSLRPTEAALDEEALDAPAFTPAIAAAALRPATVLSAAPDADPAGKKPDPERELGKSKRRVLFGTGLFKLGLEALSIAVPLLALQATGSATLVASFVVVAGIAQAVAGGIAGTLLRRVSAPKLLAGAFVLQTVSVGALLAATQLYGFSPWIALPLHAVTGLGLGAVETARRYLPPSILGSEEAVLKKFNARVHIVYEIAGVAGAIAIGLIVKEFDPLKALLVLPPAFLAAAWYFSRVKAKPQGSGAPAALGIRGGMKHWFRDLAAGARTVFSDGRYRLAYAALLVPMVLHKLLEGVVFPVYAKRVLEEPSAAAWLLGASNFGEMLGALLLLKYAARKGPFAWLRLLALGLAALWVTSSGWPALVLVPVIAFRSLAWAASDLSLMSFMQARLPEQGKAQALGFVFSSYLVATTLGSLALGALLDGAGVTTGLLVFNGALTAAALWLWWLSRRSAKVDAPPTDPDL